MVGATAAASTATEYSDLFVVLLGIGTVFVGLICLILLCTLMGVLFRSLGTKEADGGKPSAGTPAGGSAPKAAAPTAPTAPVSKIVPCKIPNRGEFMAAVSAAIAEDLGTDASKLRIVSIGKEVKPDKPASANIPNRGAFIAAVSAAIAEDLGTDVSKLRIVSVCEA